MTGLGSRLVSIIIACYNAEEYIGECLESIINQTHHNIEIIICDDNSTDDSYKILQSYAKADDRILLLKNEKNSFAAATRNRCITNSSGEYLMIQDIDDKSELNRVEVLLSHLLTENVDFVSSGMLSFDQNKHTMKCLSRSGPEFPQRKDFLWGLPFYHATTLFKRQCIEAVGGYRVSKETRRGQDYDLFMRLYASGFIGKVIDECLYWYREDSATIRRRTFSARIDECKIRFHGFRILKLYPIGFLFVPKPLIAHFYHMLKYRSYYNNQEQQKVENEGGHNEPVS